MKTILKEIKLYKYGELSKEAKEKAKLNYLESYLESSIRSESFEELIKSDLKYSKGIKVTEDFEVEFDLGYCQGDYLNLYGGLDFEELSNELKSRFYKNLSEKEIKFFEEFIKYNYIDFERTNYYGCVGAEIRIKINSEGYNYLVEHEEKEDKYGEIVVKIEKNIEEWYDEICEEYKEFGYKYFYEADEDEVEGYYEDTEQLFLENGEMYEE